MQTIHLHNFPGDSSMTVRVYQIEYGRDYDIIEIKVAEAPKVDLVNDPDSTVYFPEFKVTRLKFKRMFKSELTDVVHYDYLEKQ